MHIHFKLRQNWIHPIDGISAYDCVSRRAMSLGLDRVAGGRIPVCASILLGTLRREDDAGTVHTIHQGEGEQCFLGKQHASSGLSDICFASRQERVGDVVAASVQELWAHARIRVSGTGVAGVRSRHQQGTRVLGRVQRD